MMADLTGQRLSNQYILEERIGSGGMADVYKAWDSSRAINMAIKVLRAGYSNDPRIRKMFEDEARILKDFGHPNIARLYEFNQHQGHYYLVLEWVDGQSLDKIIKARGNPLSLDEVSKILFPITSALHYLHNNNYLHCDIKPGNILIARNQKVYLTDLGVSRTSKSDSTGGTPPYMAPEQFKAAKVSPQTDIYALGITVYEMLSGGNLPFNGKSTQSVGSTLSEKIAWEHLNLPLPPITKYNRQVPKSVCVVMNKALSKQPEERFRSANDFYNEFEKAKIGVSSAPSQNSVQSLTSATTMFFGNLKSALESRPDLPGGNGQIPTDFDRKYRGKPRLIGLSGEWKQQIILIQHNFLSLGRNTQMQIRFSDRRVSRMHATILKNHQGCWIKDENSSMGTFVNNRKVNGTVKLNHGDQIKIGINEVLEYREK